MVNGITFSEQLTTSADFAHFQNTFLNRANGVTKGCEISHADGNVYVQKGYFVVAGRFVNVVGMETITSPDVLSGQLCCKVVFEIDLTKTNTVEAFNQGYFRVLTGTEGYAAVTQEDLDAGGTLYQMPWCQYVKTAAGITGFQDLREIFNLESVWTAVAAQNGVYKADFDTYFAQQKQTVEAMIAELQGQGYVLLSQARDVKLVTLAADGWSGEAPYQQTVAVAGIASADTPVVKEYIPEGATAEEEKAIKKAASCVSYIDTADGQITVTCIGKSRKLIFRQW